MLQVPVITIGHMSVLCNYKHACKYLLGQLWVLQDLDEVDESAQEFPPLEGAGLLQDRDRVCEPLPQDLVHEPYPDNRRYKKYVSCIVILEKRYLIKWQNHNISKCLQVFNVLKEMNIIHFTKEIKSRNLCILIFIQKVNKQMF